MNTSATRWEDVYKSQTARIAELERENTELRRLIDDPNAMHSHYLRVGNGFEVWGTKRVRGLERDNVALRKTLAEADVLYEYARDDGRREWAVVETWIRRGDIIVQMDRAAFDAVRKEAQS